MEKETKGELKNYLLKAPNGIIYGLLFFLVWILTKLFFRASYKRTSAFRKHRGTLIMIGNHASYLDIPIAIVAAGYKRVNFVSSDYLYSNKTKLLLKMMQVIPKKQFQPDVKTTLLLFRALKAGRKVFLYPEAQRSIDGEPGYLDPQFARLIKRSVVPVGIVRCRGCYLAWPRWAKGFVRPGKIVAESDILLTAEEIESLGVDEIHEKVKAALNISDYDFQLSRTKPGKYLTPAPTVGLENILHHCPSCKQMQAIESTGRTLRCRQCDWEIKLGLTGFFIKVKEGPFFSNPAQWHRWQQDELSRLFAGQSETELSFPALCRKHGNHLNTQPYVPGIVHMNKTTLYFEPDDDKDSENYAEISFPRAGQESGIFADYGKNFRQYNSAGSWDFFPETKSWPIIVHDWSRMGICEISMLQ